MDGVSLKVWSEASSRDYQCESKFLNVWAHIVHRMLSTFVWSNEHGANCCGRDREIDGEDVPRLRG
ncbi:unnamed protein product [Prunus armeniaca]